MGRKKETSFVKLLNSDYKAHNIPFIVFFVILRAKYKSAVHNMKSRLFDNFPSCFLILQLVNQQNI